MRAALYARVSAEDPNESIKLPAQLALCRAHAESQGWPVILEESDDGISGTVEDRPGLQRILAAARLREIDVVVVREQDRLARGMELVGWIRHELVRCGVSVCCVLELGASHLEMSIRTVSGDEHVRRTRELVTSRMRAKASLGQYTGGGAPLGYRWAVTVPLEEEARLRAERRMVPRELRILEPEAAGVRRLFDLVDPAGEDRSLRYACQETASAPQPAARRLRNPAYAGAYCYGRKRSIQGKRDQFAAVPRSAWLIQWDHHEPIVSREQWERVQTKLDGWAAGWKAPHGPASARLALTGILRCGLCGCPMSVSGATRERKDGSRTYYYACRAWKFRESDCPGVGIHTTAGWVPSLLSTLARELTTGDLPRQIRESLRAAYAAGRSRGQAEAEVARCERVRAGILAVLRSGELRSPDTIARELSAAEDALASARARLGHERRDARPIPSESQLRRALAAAALPLRALSEAAPADIDTVARPVIHRLVERAVVPPEGSVPVTLRPGLGDERLSRRDPRECREIVIAWEPRRVA